ncbi:hypothetical protein KKB44_03010 [Candidatus Micrarchaeota archaeon]|nr:hypothetical protein [Candidatus Micrarchaeota archaeon]
MKQRKLAVKGDKEKSAKVFGDRIEKPKLIEAQRAVEEGNLLKAVDIYAKLGEKEELRKIAELLEGQGRFLDAGWAYEKAGLDEKALEMYIHADALEPYCGHGQRIALIFEGLGKIEEAMQVCLETADRFEKLIENDQAWIRTLINFYSQAMEYCERLEKPNMGKQMRIRTRLVELCMKVDGEKEDLK